MNQHKPTAEEVLSSGKILHIRPEGTSMLPLIRAGRDQVYIKKTEYDKIRKGDIVLYRNEQGILVLHRICRKTPTAFYTVGDNQLLSAGPYGKERLLGKMIAMERKGRYTDAGQTAIRLYGRVWLLRRRTLLILRGIFRGKWGE